MILFKQLQCVHKCTTIDLQVIRIILTKMQGGTSKISRFTAVSLLQAMRYNNVILVQNNIGNRYFLFHSVITD